MALPTQYGGTDFTPLNAPTTSALVTPSDSTDLTNVATKGIMLFGGTTATSLVWKLVGDSSVVTVSIPANTSVYVPGQFARVMVATSLGTGAVIVAFGG